MTFSVVDVLTNNLFVNDLLFMYNKDFQSKTCFNELFPFRCSWSRLSQFVNIFNCVVQLYMKTVYGCIGLSEQNRLNFYTTVAISLVFSLVG